MTKKPILTGGEVCVDGLGGQNVAVKNLSAGTVYASIFPNITADADNVVEIPAGGGEVVLDANGTVYLLGTGKVQCTGTPYAVLNFETPSSGGGGGASDVTKSYVDAQDSTNLGVAKSYTDQAVSMVKGDIAANTDDITMLQTEKADRSEIPTTLPANGGNAETVNNHTVNADVPEDAKFTDTTYVNMTGATETAAGKSGLVPTPPTGSVQCYLSARGYWGNPFAPTVITETGTNANDYTVSGIYFFLQNQSPLNAPVSGYNGWLLVSAYGSSTAVKQIWFRLGAVGVNDYETFVRTGVNGTWSSWRKFETVAVSAASAATYGANQDQAEEIMLQLDELDAQTVRPLRAIEAGTATDDDRNKLREIEEQAKTLRSELAELGGGD